MRTQLFGFLCVLLTGAHTLKATPPGTPTPHNTFDAQQARAAVAGPPDDTQDIINIANTLAAAAAVDPDDNPWKIFANTEGAPIDEIVCKNAFWVALLHACKRRGADMERLSAQAAEAFQQKIRSQKEAIQSLRDENAALATQARQNEAFLEAHLNSD